MKLLALRPVTSSNRGRLRLSIFVLTSILSITLPFAACTDSFFLEQAPPLLPASHYLCVEATPAEMYDAYYGSNWNIRQWVAEMQYNDKPFVFKNIEILPAMIESRGPDYLWINRIQCKSANPRNISKLKAGHKVDVVGVMRGVSKDPDLQYTLLMTECYFLPTGSLALPLDGSSDFVIPGY